MRYRKGSVLSEAAARITSIRPDICLVDHPGGHAAHSISLVLNSGRILSVTARLPSRAETSRPMRERFETAAPLPDVSATVHAGSLGGEVSRAPITGSDDLIGWHNRYAYSRHEVYDHIYLNHESDLSHCIPGSEAGLADVDRRETYRTADGLYDFLWCEKTIPPLGLVLIDLEQRRTDGKIMDYRDQRFEAVENFAIGVKIAPMTRPCGLGRINE